MEPRSLGIFEGASNDGMCAGLGNGLGAGNAWVGQGELEAIAGLSVR